MPFADVREDKDGSDPPACQMSPQLGSDLTKVGCELLIWIAPTGQYRRSMERATGFEPMTSTLGT